MNENGEREQAIRKAEAAISAAAGLAAADPRRPRYHFRARAQWMNDPNGPVFHRGWCHLFYQTNPFGELCWGETDAVVHWGHARSRDLVHWEHLPLALRPSKEAGEEHCWSGGCVAPEGGPPMIFYTSIGPTHQPKDSAEQWAALGDADLIRWTKHPGNPLLAGKTLGATRILDWRDPFVFREQERWYMVTGGHREGGRGCISLFRSADLQHWEFVGIPLEGEEENWEWTFALFAPV
jgi:beta-fructofuranosidase